MVKTIIGGMEIQRWIKSYSCQCPPVTGNNGFYDINSDYPLFIIKYFCVRIDNNIFICYDYIRKSVAK